MQFKEQGRKVQVLIYTGYDEAKGKSLVKIAGSFDKYTYKPSPGLLDKLTDQQRDELQAECDRRRQLAIGLNRQHYINTLVPNLHGACDSLRNKAALTPQQAAQIWDAIDDLSRALRQAGHPRPGKHRNIMGDPYQPTLLE